MSGAKEARILDIVGEDYLGVCPEVYDLDTPLGGMIERVLRTRLCGLVIFLGLNAKLLVELLLRLVGPIFITVCVTLISCISWIYINSIFPYYYDSSFSFGGLVHVCISALLLQGIVFNYFMAVSTPPGSPHITREEAERAASAKAKWCRTCNQPKPSRTHHCHVCGVCVQKMDHHCPWIGNCVGHANHRYFYLFLLYLWLGVVYCGVMTYGPFRDSTNFSLPWEGISTRGTVMFVFVICASVSVAVGLMLAWHTFLVLSAQTTVEFYMNRYKQQRRMLEGKPSKPVNKYDLGVRENWRYFFGDNRFFFGWLLPNVEAAPGDGTTYPTYKKSTSSTARVKRSLV